MAELYANLNVTTDPIKGFVNVGRFVLAETPAGGLLAAPSVRALSVRFCCVMAGGRCIGLTM